MRVDVAAPAARPTLPPVEVGAVRRARSLVGPLSFALQVSLWSGLLIGLVEGVLRAWLRMVPGFVSSVPIQILWIAPAFGTLLCVLLGLAVLLALAVVGRRPTLPLLVGLFSAVGTFDVLLLTDRLQTLAALLLAVGVGVQIARLCRTHERAAWRYIRRSTPAIVATALLVGAAGAGWDRWREASALAALPPAVTGSPNVILVTLDTVRADHVGAYGYERPTTPNLDAFASRGVLFESAIANASWTLPSHATLFTGYLPEEHGADWGVPLDARYPTLAEALSARGYVTGAFAANNEYVTPEWGLGRGFTRFDAYAGTPADDAARPVLGKKIALTLLPRLGEWDVLGRKTAGTVNDEAFRWLDGVGSRPFFAFLNYFDSHDPYLPPEPYRTAFSPDPTNGDVINFQFQGQSFRRKSVVTPEEARKEEDGYDGSLAYVDARLGDLFKELDRRHLTANTLVVITSDHGESFGDKDLFGHGNSLYFETLHVPLILSWPGVLPAGARVPDAIGLRDVPSTIMALVGGDPATFPGTPLSPLWTHAGAGPAEPVLSYLTSSRFKGGPASYPVSHADLASLVTDRRQLILSRSGEAHLYAWRTDPSETADLAEAPSEQAELATLRQQLVQRLAEGGSAGSGWR